MPIGADSSKKGRDGLAVAGTIGSTGAVLNLALRRQSQTVIECGEIVFRRDGPVLDITRLGVGRAVHLSAAHAAACQQCRLTLAPVIATLRGVDLRRPAKLADSRDER